MSIKLQYFLTLTLIVFCIFFAINCRNTIVLSILMGFVVLAFAAKHRKNKSRVRWNKHSKRRSGETYNKNQNHKRGNKNKKYQKPSNPNKQKNNSDNDK